MPHLRRQGLQARALRGDAVRVGLREEWEEVVPAPVNVGQLSEVLWNTLFDDFTATLARRYFTEPGAQRNRAQQQ